MINDMIWQADWGKPHRCPGCWSVVARAGFVPGVTYVCGRCGTRFARRWFLPVYGHPEWDFRKRAGSYARSQLWHRTRSWRLRDMLYPRPWWYIWGERGPLLKVAAWLWWRGADKLDKIPGFSDEVERLYNADVDRHYAEMRKDDE